MTKEYKIEVVKKVLKELDKLPTIVLKRAKEKIESLRTEPIPRDAKSISRRKGYFRVRISSYRIIYEVKKKVRIVVIVKVGHRGKVYRKL